jgi:hypothetical protein
MMMGQPNPPNAPGRLQRSIQPLRRPDARYPQALVLAVSLAGLQTPAKAITNMVTAFEAWLTRPVARRPMAEPITA